MEECNQNGHNNTQKWPTEKASAIFFFHSLTIRIIASIFLQNFVKKNVEQFTRNRNIFPKLLPNILKMTCSKGQHPTFFFGLVTVGILSRKNICAKCHEKIMNNSREIEKHTHICLIKVSKWPTEKDNTPINLFLV